MLFGTWHTTSIRTKHKLPCELKNLTQITSILGKGSVKVVNKKMQYDFDNNSVYIQHYSDCL